MTADPTPTPEQPRTATQGRLEQVKRDFDAYMGSASHYFMEWMKEEIRQIEASVAIEAQARPEQDEAVRAAMVERWGPAIMESGGDQALFAFMDDLRALATPPPATPAALDVERLHKFLLTITDDTDGDWHYPGSRRELASEIIEYARLTTPEASDD